MSSKRALLLNKKNSPPTRPDLVHVKLMVLPLGLFVLACGGAASPPASVSVSTEPTTETTPTQEPSVASEPETPQVLILSEVGFQTPESVYFDKRRDVYLVSNINGSPTDVDGNGFISRLTPQSDGQVKIELKFIDGTRKGTPLNAPKGLTVSGDTLYVADIDRVRKFDAVSGAPKGEILLKGATFINDVATGGDGSIYASDSGLTPKFESSGTDAVYKITPTDQVSALIKGATLGGPNGLIATEGGVWVATFLSGELYWVSDAGEKKAAQKLTPGQNDGLVYDNGGHLLVSSWEGSAVLSGQPNSEFRVTVSGLKAPADIGYDCSRNKLLIPLFTENKVVIQQLDK